MSSAGKPDENLMIPQAEKKNQTNTNPPTKNPEKSRIEQAKEKEYTIATKTTDKHTREY